MAVASGTAGPLGNKSGGPLGSGVSGAAGAIGLGDSLGDDGVGSGELIGSGAAELRNDVLAGSASGAIGGGGEGDAF